MDCLLIEADSIGSGTTGGTTAVLTAQHDTPYSDLIRSFGRNPQEHSWDCACHGSRYAPDGRLLDNPALRDRK